MSYVPIESMSYVPIESKKIKDQQGDEWVVIADDDIVTLDFGIQGGAFYADFKLKHVRRLIEALEEAEAYAVNYVADTTF